MFRLYGAAYKGILFPCAVAAAAGFAVSYFIPQALISMLCGGAVFLAIAVTWIALFGLDKNEKEAIGSMLRRITKRT